MIKNLLSSDPQMVNILNDSLYDFYLTDTKFWGIEHPKEEWQFFVGGDDEDSIQEFLLENAFKDSKIDKSIHDDQVYAIMEYSDNECCVIVYFVHDVFIRNETQNLLKGIFPSHVPTKSIWNRCYHSLTDVIVQTKDRIIMGK